MIYLHIQPTTAWIDLSLQPTQLALPITSRICRRMRHESLDLFYSRNRFLLDLRGWKHRAYPETWTPVELFTRWVRAIGEPNAARLRTLIFYAQDFNAHVRIHGPRNEITLVKFRAGGKDYCHRPDEATAAEPTTSNGEVGDRMARQAAVALQRVLTAIQADRHTRPLNVEAATRICDTIDTIAPFLCKRDLPCAALPFPQSEDVAEWPDTRAHRAKCIACGYHYTRVKRTSRRQRLLRIQ